MRAIKEFTDLEFIPSTSTTVKNNENKAHGIRLSQKWKLAPIAQHAKLRGDGWTLHGFPLVFR